MKKPKTFNLTETNIEALTRLAKSQNMSASTLLDQLLTSMSPVLTSTAQMTERAQYLQKATSNSFKDSLSKASATAEAIQAESLTIIKTLDKQVQNEIRRRNRVPRL
jgi:hypothetical protein